MTEKNQLVGLPVRGLLVLAALSLSASICAQQPYAETTDGQKLLNSAGECWKSAGGNLGHCGPAPDIDGDGVPSDRDQCPGTLEGRAVDERGCPPDGDRDGVADLDDRCPDTRLGVRVDSHGCDLDLDGDGIPYYRDRCQATPPGAEIDAEGCAAKVVLEDLLFEFDRAELTPQAKRLLSDLSNSVQGRPDISRLRISGHADSIGSQAYNKNLSEARARSVKRYLQAVGVDRPMDVAGYGESRPLSSNADQAGRARNRRVEIEFESTL